MLVLAHPLTETAELGVAPAFVGLLVACLAVGLPMLVARGARTTPEEGPDAVAAASSPPRVLVVLARVLGVVALLLAVAAGRLGDPDQFDNLAGALVVGFGWPALLLASAVVGDVWAALAPFDTLARGLESMTGATASPPWASRLGWVSVAGAVAWAWWLSANPSVLDPRSIGVGLGIYAVAVLAGCVLVGRTVWLRDAEIFGVAFGAVADVGRGRPWRSSSAHVAALTVLVGGLVFTEFRFSRWFVSEAVGLGLDPLSVAVGTIGLAVFVLVALTSVSAVSRWSARVGAPGALHAFLPWAVLAVGLTAAVERDRLWTSAQLVVARASDPLSLGWDLLGTADNRILLWPWGDVAATVVQLTVLTVPLMVGLLRVRRGSHGGPMIPTATWAAVLCLLVSSSVATL